MINNNAIVTLNGNLGRDPEIRSGDRGEYAYISIATQDTFQEPNGNYWRQPTVWHSIAVNNQAILDRLKDLKKGNTISLEATLDYYKKKAFVDGEERTVQEAKLTAISLNPASAISHVPAD